MPYRGSRAPLVVAYIVTFFGACAVKTNSTGERLFDPYAVDQETDQSSASASPDGTNGSTPGGGKAPNGGGNTDSSADPSAGGDPSANDAGLGSETDAGLVPMPPPELDDPIFTGDVVCSSNSFWRDGNEGSERMRPGYACNDCHRDDVQNGPRARRLRWRQWRGRCDHRDRG